MRNPEEYLDETFRETGYDDFDKVQLRMLLHCIKSAQKDAYNQAIKDAANNAKVPIHAPMTIDKNSILKLKIK